MDGRILLIGLVAAWTVSVASGAARICSEPCVLEYEIPCQQVIEDYQLFGSCCSLEDVDTQDIGRRNIQCRLTVAGGDTHCTFGEKFLQCGIDGVGCQPSKLMLKAQTVETCPPSMYPVPLEAPPPTISPTRSLQPSLYNEDMQESLPTNRPTPKRSGKKGGGGSRSANNLNSATDNTASFALRRPAASGAVAVLCVLSLFLW